MYLNLLTLEQKKKITNSDFMIKITAQFVYSKKNGTLVHESFFL